MSHAKRDLSQGTENHWSMTVHQSVVRLTEVSSQFQYARSTMSGSRDNEHKPTDQSFGLGEPTVADALADALLQTKWLETNRSIRG